MMVNVLRKIGPNREAATLVPGRSRANTTICYTTPWKIAPTERGNIWCVLQRNVLYMRMCSLCKSIGYVPNYW